MINAITSAKNPLIRHAKQLASSSKYRAENKQTILDGVHLCQAYLRAGFQPRQAIVATESLDNPEVTKLIVLLDEKTPIVQVPGSLYESVSSLDHGVALLFVIDVPENPVDATELSGDAVLLDSVQDPGNVGAMLRTAAAAGVGEVYLSSGSASAWSPKVLRAAMGAHFGLRIFEQVDLKELVTNSGVPVLATSLDADQSLYDIDLRQSTVWLFGNEGAGVSAELQKLCEKNTIIIPQSDAVESLNVAASAAVCLFEQRRQRLSGDIL